MKIYAYSITAHAPLVVSEGEIPQTIYMSSPGLVPTQTMDEAAVLISEHAFKLWPESEGWTGHKAAIIVVTAGFCEAYENAMRAGCLDMNGEEERVYELADLISRV